MGPATITDRRKAGDAWVDWMKAGAVVEVGDWPDPPLVDVCFAIINTPTDLRLTIRIITTIILVLLRLFDDI